MITPNDIEVLLHYHGSPYPHPRITAPAVLEAIGRMIRDGIMTVVDPSSPDKGCTYELTESGRALVINLCEQHDVQRRFVRQMGGAADRIQANRLRRIVDHMVKLGWESDSTAVHAPPHMTDVAPSNSWMDAIKKCIDIASGA